MISASTFAFVLALGAVVLVALVLTICAHLKREQVLQQSTIDNNWKSFAGFAARTNATLADVKRTAPTTLAAEVADLREAVERLRATHQRFQGRFDSERQRSMIDGGNGHVLTGDEEADALIALQQAKYVPPVGSKGE